MLQKKKYIFLLILTTFILSPLFNIDTLAQPKEQVAKRVTKGVVSINNDILKSAYNKAVQVSGTGFIVNKEKGIIVTNAHVANVNAINDTYITFFNGREIKGHVIYSDPLLDFSYIKVEPSEIPTEAVSLPLSSEKASLSQNVFIVGSNQTQIFSIQTGIITSVYESSGYFNNQAIRISLNTRGGSSGSPIFTEQGKVVGMNFAGGDTFALALPTEYLSDSLKYILRDATPPRKDLGVILEYGYLDMETRHGSLPNSILNEYEKKFPDSLSKCISVKLILTNSPAQNVLKPKDIIWSVNGQEIGPNMIELQKLLNNHDKNKINLQVYREAKLIDIQVALEDLYEYQIKKFVEFGNAVFYNADYFIRYITGVPLGTLMLSNIKSGSIFVHLPHSFFNGEKTNHYILKHINHKHMNHLNELIEILNNVREKKYFSIGYIYPGPIEIYNWSPYLGKAELASYIKYNPYHQEKVFTFDNNYWNHYTFENYKHKP